MDPKSGTVKEFAVQVSVRPTGLTPVTLVRAADRHNEALAATRCANSKISGCLSAPNDLKLRLVIATA